MPKAFIFAGMIVFRYLWYYFFWIVVRLGLSFFYRRIRVSGLENLPQNAPIIFGANHENAFMDALLITTRTLRFSHYLVRADVFKNPLANILLRSFNMLPIYRIRDGFSSLKSNNKIFAACYKALSKKRTLIMFPEGKHDIRRVARKLTKGISRIALGALETNSKLKVVYVVPVGLNYTQHKAFRSSVHIIFGEPIPIQQGHNYTADSLRKKINDTLLHCTVALPENHYNLLDTLAFRTSGGYQLQHPETINSDVNNWVKCYENTDSDGLDLAVDEFGSNLKKLGANHWTEILNTNSTQTLLALILLLPVYLYGFIHHFIPLLLLEALIVFLVKDKIFTASIRFSAGLFLLLVSWVSFYLYTDFPPMLQFGYILSLPLSLLIMPYYHRLARCWWSKRKFDKNKDIRQALESSLQYIHRFKQNCR